jgi:hypothetical protein
MSLNYFWTRGFPISSASYIDLFVALTLSNFVEEFDGNSSSDESVHSMTFNKRQAFIYFYFLIKHVFYSF